MILLRCYPIGYIYMLDDGRRDEKIIAIPYGDPTYNKYKDIKELPAHIFDEMAHFFKVYKSLESKETVVDEVHTAEEAKEVIREALDHYVETFCR